MTVRILQGDALAMLRTLESESVNCCVTSPPYYGLRDYGVEGQIGLELTPLAFLDALLAVFDEVRRVLRADGTCWVNLGDSYAGSGKGPTGKNGIQNAEVRQGFEAGYIMANGQRSRGGRKSKTDAPEGFKAKDLLLIPERFAIGMQERGWYVRSRIAWCKTSAMPESVRDRPTSAWEHVWLFTKAPKYWYDAEAVRTETKYDGPPKPGVYASLVQDGGKSTMNLGVGNPAGANLRNWWPLGPEPSRLDHYAAYPTELVRRCVLAGCPKGGTVLDPFLGSGTTALVADRLERSAIGIELNPAYAALARRRIEGDCPLFANVEVPA